MAIDIRIHIDLTARQKRVMRASVVAGTVIAALGVGIAIAAGPMGGPMKPMVVPIDAGWMVDGAVVSASQLSGNLNDLQSEGLLAVQSAVQRPLVQCIIGTHRG